MPLAAGAQKRHPLAFPDFFNKDGSEYAKAIREGQPFKEIVRDNDELYLRVASVFAVGSEKLTVVTSEPLDKNLVADIAANLGEITLYSAGITLDSQAKRSAAECSQPRASRATGKRAWLSNPSF